MVSSQLSLSPLSLLTSTTRGLQWLQVTSIGLATLVDLCIAISLCYFLAKERRHVLPRCVVQSDVLSYSLLTTCNRMFRTSSFITTLIVFVVATGLLTR